MSNMSQFLASTAPRALMAGQPGSNGYWRRDIFRVPGTYTWTAKKSGWIKIQALGAACGAAGNYCGASAAFGESEVYVAAGVPLTIVVGQGGAGSAGGAAASSSGTTTSISGTPVGGTPLVLVGAIGGVNHAAMTAGTATGPWTLSYPGAKPAVNATGLGSPSSGSPFGVGKVSTGAGGAGWGGGAANTGGASSHSPGALSLGASGILSATPPTSGANGQSEPFWDLRDADGSGGSYGSGPGGDGGIGAGGAAASGSANTGGRSVLGGGTGLSSSAPPPKSGAGSGGGANTTGSGGPGGDAWVAIFWDEVQ